VAAHIAPTTYIDLNRKTGVLNVYSVKTGELLYTLKIKPCNPSSQ